MVAGGAASGPEAWAGLATIVREVSGLRQAIIAFTYMGDYIANVTDGNHRYFAWGDNRDKVKDFLWPNGRNDPNVYFAKQ